MSMVDHPIPPPHPPRDQMEVVQTKWGPMERWRAVALCIGEISAVVNDAAEQAKQDASFTGGGFGKSPAPTYESKPPPLAADSTAYIADAIAKMKRRQYYRDMYARLDAAEARCEALLAKEKAKAAAHAALMAAEAAFTDVDPDETLH
jgi:hypothetical protein